MSYIMSVRRLSFHAARRGFSLVELIITTTLMGFILLILFNLYPQSVMAIKHAENRLKAATLAQSLIEQKRAGPFTDIATQPTNEEIYALTGDLPWKVDYECVAIPDTDPTKIVKVTVTVSWTERRSRQWTEGTQQYILRKETQICSVHP